MTKRLFAWMLEHGSLVLLPEGDTPELSGYQGGARRVPWLDQPEPGLVDTIHTIRVGPSHYEAGRADERAYVNDILLAIEMVLREIAEPHSRIGHWPQIEAEVVRVLKLVRDFRKAAAGQ